MTHTVTQTETVEWEEELCDNCNHLAEQHYDEGVTFENGDVKYIQVGCWFPILGKDGGRKIANNPFPRCPCMKLV